MTFVELSQGEVAERAARREITHRNIEFLRDLPKQVRSKTCRLTSANGTTLKISRGRELRETHVLVSRPGNKTLIPDVHYAIHFGRLDITKTQWGETRTLKIGFQDNLYDTCVSAITTLVRMCLPPETQSPPGMPLQTTFLEPVVDTS